MPSDAREALARQQADLVRAIQLGQPAPARIDPSKLQFAQESLARKRMRSVQKSWPEIARYLADQFQCQFKAYAATNPTSQDAGTDGYHFARWLKANGLLSNAGRIELAQWKVSRTAIPRFFRLRDPHSLVLVYRWRGIVRIARLSTRRR